MNRENAAAAIVAALKAMPERERDVIVLARFENWSTSRIARHLGITSAEADEALRRALLAVAEAIGPETGEG